MLVAKGITREKSIRIGTDGSYSGKRKAESGQERAGGMMSGWEKGDVRWKEAWPSRSHPSNALSLPAGPERAKRW